MLRVTDASLSDIFPFSGDIRIPACRSGCGMLGNWFSQIPETLPPHHRFDCRRCFGTEIESGFLTCPECDWKIQIRDGVLEAGDGNPGARAGQDLNAKVTAAVEKFLDLQPGEIALILAELPESSLNKWCDKNVERLQVEISEEELLSERAISCANGLGMAHFISGPLNLSVIRPDMLDAIILSMSSELIAGGKESLGHIPAMLRPSGRALLIYTRDREKINGANRLDKYLSGLPEQFRGLDAQLEETAGYDLVIFRHPEIKNGDGNGNGISKPDENGI
jgi:hypothetical protein